MATVDISGLQRVANTYQRDIQMLPYAVMAVVLGQHGITLFPGIQNEHTIVSFLRKQGVAKPYAPGINISDSEAGKMKESKLKVETAYASISDNIKNYKAVVMITPEEMLGSNKTKKHPFEAELMMAVVRTFGEDILDALFNAERDVADESPLGLFDGFETKVKAAVQSGEIATGEGNLIDSGAFDAPANDTDTEAYINLRNWLRQAQKDLLKSSPYLYLPDQVFINVIDAFKNKTSNKAATFIDMQEYLNKGEGLNSNIRIVQSSYMGNGDRIYLSAPGNMDFGMNTLGDETFFEVNRLDKDRNKINYWIQAEYGTRWRQHHKKMFLTNTGSLTANQLSGDYS